MSSTWEWCTVVHFEKEFRNFYTQSFLFPGIGALGHLPLIVKSAVRSRLKGMRASSEFFKALDKHLADELARAIARAKANGRKTLRPEDL